MFTYKLKIKYLLLQLQYFKYHFISDISSIQLQAEKVILSHIVRISKLEKLVTLTVLVVMLVELLVLLSSTIPLLVLALVLL